MTSLFGLGARPGRKKRLSIARLPLIVKRKDDKKQGHFRSAAKKVSPTGLTERNDWPQSRQTRPPSKNRIFCLAATSSDKVPGQYAKGKPPLTKRRLSLGRRS
jgi:hypothetical protein